jgi:3-oxoacyl-ACP reductase-like protein
MALLGVSSKKQQGPHQGEKTGGGAMSIFSSIVSAIFGSSAQAKPAAPTASAAPSAPAPSASTPSAAQTTTAASAPAASAAAARISKAEVEALIAGIAAKRGGKYNWQQSIVDLMKLLDLDSGLGARKELAQEPGYKGALDGSAEMNVWLQKQVMDKLAESGGKVPESFKH